MLATYSQGSTSGGCPPWTAHCYGSARGRSLFKDEVPGRRRSTRRSTSRGRPVHRRLPTFVNGRPGDIAPQGHACAGGERSPACPLRRMTPARTPLMNPAESSVLRLRAEGGRDASEIATPSGTSWSLNEISQMPMAHEGAVDRRHPRDRVRPALGVGGLDQFVDLGAMLVHAGLRSAARTPTSGFGFGGGAAHPRRRSQRRWTPHQRTSAP